MKNSYQFSIEPMHCQGCVKDIQKKLAANAPSYLETYQLDLGSKTLALQLREDVDETLVMNALQKILSNRIVKKQCRPYQHGWAALLGLGGAGLSILFSYLAWMSAPMVLGFSGLMIWNAWPFIKSAWQQWSARPRLNMDSLFVLTALIILASSCASLWSPWFHLSLESGFFIFGFRHLGAKVQAYLEKKMGLTVSLVERFLHQSYIMSDQSTKQAKDLQVGDIIDTKVGDTLAFDAIVVACVPGTTAFDHFQDGGFLPRDIQVGQILAAGTKLHTGALQLRVTKELRQSRFAEIDRSIKEFESLQKKASILGRAEAWLQWFIPALLLLSLAAFLVLSSLYSVAIGVQAVTAILVSACPCTLGLIIPMALRMGAFKASRQHFYFKSSKALETAAKTDILVLDYNGSLTLGQPEMMDFQAREPALAKATIKAFEACMLAQRPGQVIGMAIAKAVEDSPLIPMNDFCWVNGGVRGVTAAGTFWFGNDELLRHLGIAHGQRPHRYYLLNEAQQIEASFVMRDQPRPGVKQLIQRLLAKGKQVKVCTGADASTTEEILSTLNIGAEHLVTNCKPDQKKAYIEALSKTNPGKVIAMLGDGLNDRQALEAAHLRIWVKHQQLSDEYQTLMQNIADLEFHGEHLPQLDSAFDVASQTFALIQQNLCLSLVYNLVILTCACGALCMLPPALGVGLMIVQSLLLSLNTYRVLLQAGPKSEIMSNIDLQPA